MPFGIVTLCLSRKSVMYSKSHNTLWHNWDIPKDVDLSKELHECHYTQGQAWSRRADKCCTCTTLLGAEESCFFLLLLAHPANRVASHPVYSVSVWEDVMVCPFSSSWLIACNQSFSSKDRGLCFRSYYVDSRENGVCENNSEARGRENKISVSKKSLRLKNWVGTRKNGSIKQKQNYAWDIRKGRGGKWINE